MVISAYRINYLLQWEFPVSAIIIFLIQTCAFYTYLCYITGNTMLTLHQNASSFAAFTMSSLEAWNAISSDWWVSLWKRTWQMVLQFSVFILLTASSLRCHFTLIWNTCFLHIAQSDVKSTRTFIIIGYIIIWIKFHCWSLKFSFTYLTKTKMWTDTNYKEIDV
jgi:hypothetical protein